MALMAPKPRVERSLESSDWFAQSSGTTVSWEFNPIHEFIPVDLVKTVEQTTKATQQKTCRFLVKAVNLCHLSTEISINA